MKLGSLTLTRSAISGVLLLGFVIAVGLIGPMLTGDPNTQSLDGRLEPPGWRGASGKIHLLGTDQLGRDLLARIASGARITLLISFFAVVIAGLLGVGLGLLAGYFGGWTERIVMRVADVQLSIPFIILVILIVGAIGPSIGILVAVLGLSGWVLYARVVRATVLSIRELEYITAARALGLTHLRIMVKHVLPGAAPSAIVIASFAIAQMIVWESALSFLGLGVQPPAPSWGRMLSESREYMLLAPWLAVVPGVMIMAAVLGANLLGDWLRDELDPRVESV